MGRKIHSHILLLPLKQLQDILLPVKFRHRRTHRLDFLHIAEKRRRGVHLVVAVEFSIAHQVIDEAVAAFSNLEELAAVVAERVKSAGAAQGLESLAVNQAREPLHKVPDIAEQASFLPFLDDGRNGI